MSCYEAGRDGFWIHRYLTSLGVENLVVDSSSIEVNRRARRAKTDRMDVEKLLAMLLRYVGGERTVWRIVRVPSEADEHRRQLHREFCVEAGSHARDEPDRGFARHRGRADQGGREIWARLDRLMQWDGQPLPERCGSVSLASGRSGAHDDADPRPRRARRADAPRESDRSGRAGQTTPSTARHRGQCRLAVRDGILCLAPVPQSSPGRWGSRVWWAHRTRVALSIMSKASAKRAKRVRRWRFRLPGAGSHQRQSALTQWYNRRFAHGGTRRPENRHRRGRPPVGH